MHIGTDFHDGFSGICVVVLGYEELAGAAAAAASATGKQVSNTEIPPMHNFED